MNEALELLMQILPMLLTVLMGYITANAAAGYFAWKDVITQLAVITAALNDAMAYLCEALVDDQVTEEEFRVLFDRTVVIMDESQKLIKQIAATGFGSIVSGLFTGCFREDYRKALVSRIPLHLGR